MTEPLLSPLTEGSQVGAAQAAAPLSGIDAVRLRTAPFLLRFTALGREASAFAVWVEEIAGEGDTGVLRIRLEDDGAAAAAGEDPPPIGEWSRLWRFLRSLGVRELELDSRLESNQVADVLALLYAERRSLRHRRAGRATAPATLLRSSSGMNFACTSTRISDRQLTVTYSYCMTRFSRLVRWFKTRQTHLRDHRALFRAAPRYATLVGLAPMAVFLLYAVHESPQLLLATSLLGSGLLAAATYFFFMTVGSVEYDNEEQAHILRQAYDKLKLYADRIAFDMDGAREVQQRLLPDLQTMPLAERLEWAASFQPQEEVGGDYFDAAVTSHGRLALIFADVSGHGLGAALITAIIKTSFEAWLERDDGLETLVKLLNQRLFDLTPDRSFAAVAVGLLDPETGGFSYCNCGHSPYPYLLGVEPAPPLALDAAQFMLLGILPGIDPDPATVMLEPGDTVLFATDGLTEARDVDDEEFGDRRLEDYLDQHRGSPLPELVAGLVTAVERFAAAAGLGDDRTILAFRVR